jgi:hypothetical protein
MMKRMGQTLDIGTIAKSKLTNNFFPAYLVSTITKGAGIQHVRGMGRLDTLHKVLLVLVARNIAWLKDCVLQFWSRFACCVKQVLNDRVDV